MTELAVPDEALAEFARTHGLPDPRYTLGNGGVEWDSVKGDVRAVASPVVVAELLALGDRVAALAAAGDDRYNAGYDDAVGAFRELIADRCDELGVKVEDL